jgi:hypothetical protein
VWAFEVLNEPPEKKEKGVDTPLAAATDTGAGNALTAGVTADAINYEKECQVQMYTSAALRFFISSSRTEGFMGQVYSTDAVRVHNNFLLR